MLKVNTCGMSCPQPVLMTKKALAQNPAEVEVITDNLTAKNNVERFLKNAGYNVEIKKRIPMKKIMPIFFWQKNRQRVKIMEYTVLFFTHSGAIKFRRKANSLNIPCELMPVPRVLSSNCSICAKINYEGEIKAF